MAGRVAVVTGGASGIGRALGQALVRRGDLVVLADVDAEGAESAAASLTAVGPGRARAERVDVRDAAAVRALVDRVAAEHGRLDLMVNNAGIGVGGEVDELTVAHWDRVIDVNVRGVVHGVAAAYPLMVRQGRGHIVNTASVAGLVAAPLVTPYAMTKHAVVGLSLSLRAEAADRGVRVSALCPGVIDTPLIDSRGPGDLPDVLHELDTRSYLTRLGGPPLSADRLAVRALRGIDRNEALILAPARVRVAWWAQRLAPGLVQLAGRRGVRWARAHQEHAMRNASAG